MREDYLEKLDKMFPDGYIILYTNPNKTLRMALHNPYRFDLIEEYRKLIVDNIEQ